jgi:SSS family solute:Na+ symporter
MDFIHKFYPKINSKQLMWIGRITTLLFMLLAIVWAPQIENFKGLFNYLQQVLAYAVSPVVAVFLLGTFWRRANQSGAFAALMAGLVIGTLLFMANVVFGWISIHFLYIAPILFTISLIVGIIISLLTPAPRLEQIEGHVWTSGFYKAETQELRKLPWSQNYRILGRFTSAVSQSKVLAYLT